jgi:5-formyltetrahydrofolate cyclo-ligase
MPTAAPPGLRKSVLAAREALTSSVRGSLSEKICHNVEQTAAYSNCLTPLIYVSFRSEVETQRLIEGRLRQGLHVAVPKTDKLNRRLLPYLIRDCSRDLRPGAYGILEPDLACATPISPEELDVVIVPGSVFDRRCGRYGYGGGYYDRFLNDTAQRAIRIGLAFAIQLLPEIPLKPHDQRMDIIMTECECIECSQSGARGTRLRRGARRG